MERPWGNFTDTPGKYNRDKRGENVWNLDLDTEIKGLRAKYENLRKEYYALNEKYDDAILESTTEKECMKMEYESQMKRMEIMHRTQLKKLVQQNEIREGEYRKKEAELSKRIEMMESGKSTENAEIDLKRRLVDVTGHLRNLQNQNKELRIEISRMKAQLEAQKSIANTLRSKEIEFNWQNPITTEVQSNNLSTQEQSNIVSQNYDGFENPNNEIDNSELLNMFPELFNNNTFNNAKSDEKSKRESNLNLPNTNFKKKMYYDPIKDDIIFEEEFIESNNNFKQIPAATNSKVIENFPELSSNKNNEVFSFSKCTNSVDPKNKQVESNCPEDNQQKRAFEAQITQINEPSPTFSMKSANTLLSENRASLENKRINADFNYEPLNITSDKNNITIVNATVVNNFVRKNAPKTYRGANNNYFKKYDSLPPLVPISAPTNNTFEKNKKKKKRKLYDPE